MLPTKFGMTLCFTEEELLELKGTSLYKATKLQDAGLREHFYEKVKGLAETILKSVGSFEREVRFEDFLWANCIFWTRALNIPCPLSLVSPQTSPTPPSWLHQEEQCVMDGKAVFEGLSLEHEHTGTTRKQEHCSSGCSVQSPQHGATAGVHFDNNQAGQVQSKFHAEDASKCRSVKDDGEVGSLGCGTLDMTTSLERKQEQSVWVEGLVPGIDFCNHASQAAAIWEVDDENGSATGVRYSMYLVTGPGVFLPSNTEIRISYGKKGNEELLYLYGFVVDDNPDDYLMVNCPKEAVEKGVCSDAKFLLLEEQKLPLRWLLPSSLLKGGCGIPEKNEDFSASYFKTSQYGGLADGYSWSGHRKPPPDLEKQVFPEDLMAALRIISMTEDEVQGTTSLLAELLEPESQRVPSAEDIRAAVWEVCGNAGALQLLHDLLTSKMMEMEEGTGSEDADAYLLEKDAEARKESKIRKQHGSSYGGDKEFIEKNLLSRNKRACVVYRKGQKYLVRRFLQEVEHALEWWIT